MRSLSLFRRTMTTNDCYKSWSREKLIERLLALEGSSSSIPPPALNTGTSTAIAHSNHNSNASRPVPTAKEFNFSNHPKRKIALRFCYSGWDYCGLAYQTGLTELPTVEGVLFAALAKARLIDPENGMEGCGWEKCGRTDRGVSAAGQVISLWVRSAIGRVEKAEQQVQQEKREQVQELQARTVDGLPGLDDDDFGTLGVSGATTTTPETKAEAQGRGEAKPRHELDYIAILNRLLPPTIRILAWAPVANAFSARFSCKYRHYKYFFSSHGLDILRMRGAAYRLVGEHDFRNLCKIDAQKQITMFRRIISRADIEPVDTPEGQEGMYVFNLVGSAFLYHQVRHIMAILFLVGTGLEEPSLVTQLMNVVKGAEVPKEGNLKYPDNLEVVDRKPEYQMADALPLMLWDCGYTEEDVQWRTWSTEPDDDTLPLTEARRSGSGTETDLYHQLHSIWNRSGIHTILDQHFLRAAEQYHEPPFSPLPLTGTRNQVYEALGSFNYPVGGGMYKRVQKYVPVLERNRLATVEVINERWRMGKGLRRAERKAGAEGEDDDGGDE